MQLVFCSDLLKGKRNRVKSLSDKSLQNYSLSIRCNPNLKQDVGTEGIPKDETDISLYFTFTVVVDVFIENNEVLTDSILGDNSIGSVIRHR